MSEENITEVDKLEADPIAFIRRLALKVSILEFNVDVISKRVLEPLELDKPIVDKIVNDSITSLFAALKVATNNDLNIETDDNGNINIFTDDWGRSLVTGQANLYNALALAYEEVKQ